MHVCMNIQGLRSMHYAIYIYKSLFLCNPQLMNYIPWLHGYLIGWVGFIKQSLPTCTCVPFV